MMAKSWFIYVTPEGPTYELGCEFTLKKGKPFLIACDMYRIEGEYVGYWARENMSVQLVNRIQKWLKGDAACYAALLKARNGRNGLT